jgi:processive 1,2-diacylglycerol beta-glucosyltransferase
VANERCDILILSASFGGGHNQAARALTQALQMQMPSLRIITIDYCDLLYPFLNRLSQFSYNQSIRHFPVGYALYYQATGNISSDSFWQRRLNRMGYTELIMLVNRLEPRLVISTFPLPAGVLSEMKEAGDLGVPVVTVITDICVHSQWIHPRTDLYIVGSGEVEQGLIERGIESQRIAVTGIPILPGFATQRDLVTIRKTYGLAPDDRLVLFMGGNEGKFGTTRFDHLTKDLPQNVKALIVTAANDELFEKLQPLAVRYPRLLVYKYVDNISGLMDIADVLVTKAGGITVSEALVKGLPMIIFKPTPGHEEANAEYLWHHRAALVTRRISRLKKALERMVINDRFRGRFSRNSLAMAKPDSALYSARRILQLLTPHARTRYYHDITLRSEIRA